MPSFETWSDTEKHILATYLPWSMLIGPGIVENKDGSIQKSYRFRGPDLDSSTKRELMGMAGAFNNALRRLGDGWALFIEAQRNAVNHYPKSSWPNAACQLIDEERSKQFCHDNFANSFYMTVLFQEPSKLESKGGTWFFKKKAKPEENACLEVFQKSITELEGLLRGLFPIFEPLSDDETLTYLHGTVSTKRHSIRTPDIPLYLDHILCDESIEHGQGMRLGSKNLKVLSIKSFPTESFPGILDALNDLSFSFRWVTRFLCMSHESAENEIAKIRRVYFAGRKKIMTVLKEVASQTESGISETGALNKSQDADEALQLLEQNYVSYGFFTATLCVWHEDIRIANERIEEAASIINRLGFACQIEELNAFDAWLSSVPGHTQANVRKPLIHSLNFAHMAPLSAVWSGEEGNKHFSGPPHFVAKCRGNSSFNFSSNVGDVGHTLIFGPTGSGKSTLLSFMAAQWLRYPHAQVFIFDKGRSSRVLTEAALGSFYDIGAEGEEFCFQPLKHVHEQPDMLWAQEWVLEILADQGLQITTELKSEVWQAIIALGEQDPSSRTLSVLKSLIQDSDARNALSHFCLGGPYGYLFDAAQERDDKNSWQVFETTELFEKKGAFKPALSYLFHRLSKRFTGEPTLLILDEAWLFLESSLFAARIKQWLKELRKSNVYVIFATQSLADALQSSIAISLKESCPSKIFLPNPNAIDAVSAQFYESMGLNERQIEIISEALPKREYYLSSPLGNRLFDLSLGPLALALCASSSVADQKILKQIKESPKEHFFLEEFLRLKGVIQP